MTHVLAFILGMSLMFILMTIANYFKTGFKTFGDWTILQWEGHLDKDLYYVTLDNTKAKKHIFIELRSNGDYFILK